MNDADNAERAETFVYNIAVKKGVPIRRLDFSPMAESISGRHYWIDRPIPFTRGELSELREIWERAEITFDGDENGDEFLVSNVDVMPDAPFAVFEIAAKPKSN